MQLGVKDAAGIFEVSEKTIHLWIKDRNLPAYQIGDQYRFNRSELLEWATGRKIDISPHIMDAPVEGDFTPPRLDEALKLGGVFHKVGGTDKSSVLRAVVEAMHLPAEVDRGYLLDMLLTRESLGSTAIGDGIAIPHVRHPIVLHVSHPTVQICFLEHPIEFGAADVRPVDTLIVLASPTVRAHQHVLSKLAFALKDPRFKAALTRKSSFQAIWEESVRIEASASDTHS